MNLAHWLSYISQQHPQSIALGLERVSSVAGRLGFKKTQAGYVLGATTIVVGGTNGKGSVCAMLESILMQSGYRVALYTSPHLLRFTERLRIDGAELTDDQWSAAFERVNRARGVETLTYFEFTTLAAFELIREQSLDAIILEVGLGGRLDAVNIVDHQCAVLTSVDLDHQHYLGDTREKIGWEKSHIARSGKPFIVADPMPTESIMAVAEEIKADLWLLGRDFNYQGDRQQWSWAGRDNRRNAMAYPALRGANQLLNASAALAVLSALKDALPVSQGAVREGFALVALAGRFQVLPGQPAVVLDVAHNPHAAGVLAVNLDAMGFFPNTYAVAGILADKDCAEIFRRIGDRVDHWCLASLHDEQALARSQTAESLAKALRQSNPGADIDCFESPALAFEHARSCAQPNDRIIVFGSFLTVAHVMTTFYGR